MEPYDQYRDNLRQDYNGGPQEIQAQNEPFLEKEHAHSTFANSPYKFTIKHNQLDVKDISGASPKQLLKQKGRKKQDFFPENEVMNNFYNSQAVSGVSRYNQGQKAKFNFGTVTNEAPSFYQWPDQLRDRSRNQDPGSFEPERRSNADFLDQEMNRYNQLSNFDKLHNKRYNMSIPIALSTFDKSLNRHILPSDLDYRFGEHVIDRPAA